MESGGARWPRQRGGALAVKFQLADGKNADILTNSIEGFPVRTPEDFLAFLRARLPDPATGQPRTRCGARFGNHPNARDFIERLMQKPVPASYGQASYHGEHAFRSPPRTAPVDSAAIAGCPRLERPYPRPDEGSSHNANFLREKLDRRIQNGPVVFRPVIAIGAEGRPDRRRHRLVASRPVPGRAGAAAGNRHLSYVVLPTNAAWYRSPPNLTDGIDLWADPLLLARSSAYSISYDHRSKGA